MRIVFFGSPDFAVPSLAALVAAGHDVVLAVSQPAKPVGTSAEVADPPLARRAREPGIPVLPPPTPTATSPSTVPPATRASSFASSSSTGCVDTPTISRLPPGSGSAFNRYVSTSPPNWTRPGCVPVPAVRRRRSL